MRSAVIRLFSIEILMCFKLGYCVDFLMHSCMDANWKDYCKISMGDTYIGDGYAKSRSGKPCVEGTICEYNYDAISIQCQISSTFDPYYEDCNIPMCSELPLCDSQLENFNGTFGHSGEGEALVSTPEHLMIALRDHNVTKIELLDDITISNIDFKGIPVIFKQGRNLVINKQGKARLTFLLSDQDTLKVILVFSGANVTTYRMTFLGNPFAGSYIQWEKLGHITTIDSEYFITPCSMISAYIWTMSAFQMDTFITTITGNEKDSTLEFYALETGVFPGGGGHAGTVLYDPEKNLGGTQRYVNSIMRCNPSLYTPPPPTVTSLFDQEPDSPTSTNPSSPPNNSAQEGEGFGAYGLAVGVVVLVVALVTSLAGFVAYRRRKRQQPAELNCDTAHREIVICKPNEESYSERVQRMAEQSDDKTVLSSAKLCEEIAGVVASVTQMASENRNVHIQQAQDFCALAKSVTFNGIPGYSSCPNFPTPNAVDANFEGNSRLSRNASGASSSTRSALAELQAGNVVNGYGYVRHLGSGTHADVLLVCKVDTEIRYTMKISKDANAQGIIQEAYLLAMLNHPNIVQHEETFVHNGDLIVVTEYCFHGDLQQCLAKFTGPFPESIIRSILFQLAFAVSHMHKHAVAHRDIKPSNIFVSEEGVLKLGDLGTGRVIVNTSDTFAGTPMFMAPQIIAGEPYTKECDVYSLGSVIYYLCCGKVAYSEAKSMDELKVLQMEGPDVSIMGEGYSECLKSAVSSMMSSSEVLRPSASEIVRWKWLQQDVGEEGSNTIDFAGVVRELLQSASIHETS